MVDMTERLFFANRGDWRAWLEGNPTGADLSARVGEPGRFVIVYEVGPLGIQEGGTILLQVPPYWGWSTPQVEDPDAPGHTLVTSEAPGVALEPETVG